MAAPQRTIAALALALFLAAPPGEAATLTVVGSSGGAFSLPVTSLKEARFRTVIKQQYDFSCGSAALATLLTYHYDFPVTEQDVFNEMFDGGNQEKIRVQGFSLLDIKKYLEAHGFSAGGYKAPLEKLAELKVPAIVLINVGGYRHFVVIKGVSASEVLLGDPATGSRTLPRDEFERIWTGLLFLVRNKKDLANRHFNTKREWHVREKAPVGTALTNSELSHITVLLK